MGPLAVPAAISGIEKLMLLLTGVGTAYGATSHFTESASQKAERGLQAKQLEAQSLATGYQTAAAAEEANKMRVERKSAQNREYTLQDRMMREGRADRQLQMLMEILMRRRPQGGPPSAPMAADLQFIQQMGMAPRQPSISEYLGLR